MPLLFRPWSLAGTSFRCHRILQRSKGCGFFLKITVWEVAEFIALTRNERKVFAEKKNHPFYKTYVSVSEIKRKEIKALIHMSYDYNPNRYWVGISFIWLIGITIFWFIGLIIQGAIILVRTEDEKRRALIKKSREEIP